MPAAAAPVTEVPYVDVPAPLSATYGFLNRCAVHFCASMKVFLSGGEKKPVVVFVASDAIYTGSERGKLYRRIPLESVRGYVTNCDSASAAALKNKQVPFTLLMLRTEAPDLLLLGTNSYAAAVCVDRILTMRGKPLKVFKRPLPAPADLPKGAARLPANVADTRQPAQTDIPRRAPAAPESPRNKVKIKSENAKTDGVKANATQVKKAMANDAEAKKKTGDVSAPAASPVRDRSIVNAVAIKQSEDIKSPHAKKSKPTRIPSDPAAAFTAEQCVAEQGDHNARKQDSAAKEAPPLIDPSEVAPLPEVLLDDTGDADKYLCYDEEINVVFAAFPIDAAMRVDFPRASSSSAALYYVIGVFHLEAESNGPPRFVRAVLYITRTHLYIARSDAYVLRCCALSLLESIVTGDESIVSGIALPGHGLSFALLRFTALPDVCVAFATANHNRALLGILRRLSFEKWQHVRGNALCDVRLPPHGQRDAVVPIPERPRRAARDRQNYVDHDEGTLHMHMPLDARGEFVAALARVVDAERRTALTTSPADAYVSFALRQEFLPFRDVRLYWGGAVHLFIDENKGVPSAAVHAHLFVSATQIVVVDRGILLRVMPLAGIEIILVRTINLEKKERFIAFVSRAKDADVCVLVTGRESDTLLRQTHEALRAADPTRVPPIACSSGAADERKLRIRPNKGYVLPSVEFPITSEAVRYRNYVCSRVTDVLRRCDPNNVHTATTLTEQYFGRELELLSLLYNVYPEYASIQEQAQQERKKDGREQGDQLGYEGRLTALCKRYIPDSVGVVRDVLRCYAGREEELMHLLVQRYGPEPHMLQQLPEPYATNLSDAAVRSRLLHFYRRHEPKKIADIESIMLQYKGRERLLFETLEKLYGTLPSSSAKESVSYPLSAAVNEAQKDDRNAEDTEASDQLTYRERLDSLFTRYAPNRVGELDSLLDAYNGHEDVLLCGLVAKYGPEPVPCTRLNRARLAAFFARAGLAVPDEEALDHMMRDFRGSEADFFQRMEQQYGAEHPLPFAGVPDDMTAAAFAQVDPLTALPFVDVPLELQGLFPSLAAGRAALLWFGRALHWEQPAAPEVRCVYVTNAHVFVGSAEADTARCAALERLEGIFINAKRERTDMQACLLLRLRGEHDLFLALPSDVEAQELLRVLVAALTHYHFGQRCRVLSVASLADHEIDVDCHRSPDFVQCIAAVPQRPRQCGRSAVHGTKETNNTKKDSKECYGDNYIDEDEGLRAEREACTLRSRLHDALVQRGGQQKILEQDAALLNSGWGTIHRLAARQRKVFGTAPKCASGSAAPLLTQGIQSNFPVAVDVPNRMDKLNPFQRVQFKRFSINGTYGIGAVATRNGNGDVISGEGNLLMMKRPTP